jgi:hypothetical protein
VKASEGSVVGTPPPQPANPIKTKANQSQVILAKRNILSSKTILKLLIKNFQQADIFIITES